MREFHAFCRLVERIGWTLLTLVSVLYVIVLERGIEAPLVALLGDAGPAERVG